MSGATVWVLMPVPENPRSNPRESLLVTFGSQWYPDRYSRGTFEEREFPLTGCVVTRQRERLRLARQRNSCGKITMSIQREVINDSL